MQYEVRIWKTFFNIENGMFCRAILEKIASKG